MALLDDIDRLLRDHTGYTGDGQGGNGALPVGDRSTLRHFPDMRTWRELLKLIAQTMGDPSALQEIIDQLGDKADIVSLLNVASEVARKANTDDVPMVDGAFGRGGQEAGFGLRFLDERGRIAGGFDEVGNPEFVWFGSFGRGGADQRSGVSIVTGDDREIDLGGSGGWTPDDLPEAQPRDNPALTVVWRDGDALLVRDPIDSLYSRPRSEWFNNLASLYALYDALVAAHPGYVTRSSLGQDAIGNHIYQYEFTPPLPLLTQPHQGDVLAPEDVAQPKVIVLSGTHGGERAAQMGTYIFAYMLCNGWRRREEYRRLRFGSRIVIIPAATPSAVDTASRGNHNGVDINRNYNWRWDQGGSTDPASSFYRGPSPASEVETQILQNLPEVHPDAIGIIDRHDHGDSHYLWWLANASPSVQPALNRVAEQLASDIYRLEISPDMPLDQPSAWLTGAIPGNGVGYWAAQGIPAMFIEQPNTQNYPLLGGNVVALHRAAETLTQRMVTALIEHHLTGTSHA